MGWYRIDPNTGLSLATPSSLSKPPDFVLLNAVPGADADDAACYLGDGPWDMGSGFVTELRELLAKDDPLTREEASRLILDAAVPPRLRAAGGTLCRAVKAFWADIDGCYEDDWDRPARQAEKRWICENVVQQLCGR
jgi:hypothetical protein